MALRRAELLLEPILRTSCGIWVSPRRPWLGVRPRQCPERYPDLSPVEHYIMTGTVRA